MLRGIMLALSIFPAALQVNAAQVTNSIFTSIDPVNPKSILIQSIIDISGEIEAGDDNRIKDNFIDVVKKKNAFITKSGIRGFTKHNVFYISSVGGQVSAAFDMVKVLKQIETTGPTMIAVKGTCASACTIILFSLSARFARLCDRIGVHRASVSGIEGEDTFASSTVIADYLIKSGVPWEVVKKMLLTSASRISWLTLDDMRLAQLSVLPGACTSAN